MARRQEEVQLQAVPVHVSRIDINAFEGAHLTVSLTCSAGFYVRSFAHALGQLVGTGACLKELRRTRSGDFAVEDAVRLEDVQEPGRLGAHLTPMDALLRSLPARVVTSEGRQRVAHGRELTPAQFADAAPPDDSEGTDGVGAAGWVRLLDSEGHLLAVGQAAGATLHPSVVLI